MERAFPIKISKATPRIFPALRPASLWKFYINSILLGNFNGHTMIFESIKPLTIYIRYFRQTKVLDFSE